MMNHFISLNELALTEALPGAFLASLQTENLTIAYTDTIAGAEIPLHHHPEEAVDILLDGELEMQIGETTAILKKGMMSIVPSNIPHRAKAITECRIISVFYPKRR